jgi:hypothetical protein
MRRVCGDLLFPFNWWKLSGHAELCHFGLAMTARQANGSHLLDIGLFGDFILADCQRTRHDRSTTPVTGVGGEMKVLFSHTVHARAFQKLLHIATRR